jgi:hypothetical protein
MKSLSFYKVIFTVFCLHAITLAGDVPLTYRIQNGETKTWPSKEEWSRSLDDFFKKEIIQDYIQNYIKEWQNLKKIHSELLPPISSPPGLGDVVVKTIRENLEKGILNKLYEHNYLTIDKEYPNGMEKVGNDKVSDFILRIFEAIRGR